MATDGRERAEQCLHANEHTPAPEGYLQWHEWAEKKLKTHDPFRCPHCQFFVIWKPRKRKRGGD